MQITITGGKGFIGQYVAEVALERGHEVRSFDLCDGQNIADFGVADAGDATIHLAGTLGTAELFDKPEVAVEVNVLGSLKVIKACSEAGSHLVMITMPQVWQNVYQSTKQCAGSLADAWMMHEGLKVTHVMAFNAFGAGQHLHGVRKIVPTFANAAWRGEDLSVWGTGESFMDLVWARDLAEVLVRSAEIAPGGGETIEAGSGVAVTVNEFAEMVLAHTGSDSQIVHQPMRKGEAEFTSGTVSLSRGLPLIGFHPVFREAELLETIDWYKADRP